MGGEQMQNTTPTADLWGRSLPLQTLGCGDGGKGGGGPSSEGARFVSQLATDRMVAERGREQEQQQQQQQRPATGNVPRGFVMSGGTVVADDSARGDVDAVMAGKAAVCALPTWPQGHAFSLLDVVAVEALREDPASGLPLWLCERDDDDARVSAAGGW